MTTEEKRQAYERVSAQADSLLGDQSHATLKQMLLTAVLCEQLPYYFWAGFYCMHRGELLLGAYVGSLPCLNIPLSKGVCGRAARLRQTQIVADVHADPEHIACDSRSNSEIVVPFFDKDGRLLGVFDADSTDFDAFDHTDRQYLEALLHMHFAEKQLECWNYEL